MARLKSPTGGKQKRDSIANNIPAVSTQPGAAEISQSETRLGETRPDTKKLGIVKADRPSVVPINLEDEIRRRAYELSERRGFESGHETEDWLSAEREVLQRYRQHSA